VSVLEDRYRAVLRVLPASYRAVWEEEMVCTFLDSTRTGDPDDDEFLPGNRSAKGLSHRSRPLLNRIRDYIDHWNTNAAPFVWTARADEILAKVASFKPASANSSRTGRSRSLA